MRNRSGSTPSLTPSVDSSQLRATAAGTTKFSERFATRFAADYFRATTFGPTVSSIGIGTYLGESTADDDASYEAAVAHAIESGVNVIDTAINYRCQRSERAVGAAIQHVLAVGPVARHELLVCSKGGYIPLNGAPPATREEYQKYVQREFIDPEILRPEDIVAGGHSLAPRFLRYCLAKTRQNLGLRTIDVYYVHNPEQQLGSIAPEEVRARLRAAFMVLEDAATRGEIGVYGVATWEGLRLPPDAKCHLGLESMVGLAREVGGNDHHFRAVQLPLNLGISEGARVATQPLGTRQVTVLEAATELGMSVFGSATLLQAKLTSGLPAAIGAAFPGSRTDAQRAISFARSLPGITSALVGMKRIDHVDENLASASS
ncbi:MAG: NADP-dependent oxidoreductase domain protein [Gemmatimonadetes bacterium]|nr:NADP-dependent oxidoreductase domain protein [Gemmatimonadota bacterium]